MRVAQKRPTRQQVSSTLSVSAPVGGWNARDPLAEMKPADAVMLENFFCTPYDVQVRYGYSKWATGIPGTVNTLCSYSPPSGPAKLFAAAGTSIYDASNAGAVGAAVGTGYTSDKWQHANFGTAGGNFLIMANGFDLPLVYNGSTWANISVTGVDATKLISVFAFKSRLWFVEKNSARIWYLPTLSIGGAVQQLDFGSLFSRGGYLMAMGDWSLDAGYGMDDYAVFVSSEGQVAVYKGTDPASTATWSLIGIYDVGSPIGRRCLMKYAGDLTLICQDGLAPLSKALMSSRVNSQEMLTDKIQHAIGDYVSLYSSNFGWEVALFPKESMLLMNIPISAGLSIQVAMNTISGAWSRFTGWNATCFELHVDNLYYGTAGGVCKAWDTNADAGANINFNGQQSFSYFGRSGQLKKVNMVRPIISTDGQPTVLFGVNADFDTSDPLGVPSFSPSSVTPAIWDISTWDSSSVWSGDLAIKRDWQTAFAIGYCLSGHMKGYLMNTRMRWASTDMLIDGGGVL